MAFNLFKKKDKKEKKPAAPAQVEAATEAGEAGELVATPPPVSGRSVIKRMHLSEKSSRVQAYNQYVFVVDKKATKPQVATEVHERYKVDVRSVKITKLPSKNMRVGLREGKTSGVTKAVVVLKAGQSIATS
ncbi:MAG TPA: 50S ribosomal protein L23 [Candidatus Paceibacterota bacterium]|nr:50S ribosomal protein L23 [Candidatus Paceibacterota bacterium]